MLKPLTAALMLVIVMSGARAQNGHKRVKKVHYKYVDTLNIYNNKTEVIILKPYRKFIYKKDVNLFYDSVTTVNVYQ